MKERKRGPFFMKHRVDLVTYSLVDKKGIPVAWLIGGEVICLHAARLCCHRWKCYS